MPFRQGLVRSILVVAGAVLPLLLAAVPAAADAAGCRWTRDFVAGGFDGAVRASAVWDDGSGPALYVGGHFTALDGEPFSGVARWDGAGWSPVGEGVDGSVHALAVFDEGSGPKLFAAGDIHGFNGLTTIARWDGVAWTAVAPPGGFSLLGWANALAVFDDGSGPALYVGGFLHWVNGEPAANVARWDGSAWSLPGGFDDEVFAFAVYDDGSGPALYAGGRFESTFIPFPVRHLARWDGSGSSWMPVGTLLYGHNTDGPVRALAVWDDGSGPGLYVGGEFDTAGHQTSPNLVRWDGQWSPVGTPAGTDGRVSALAVHGTRLVVGGDFQTAGGVAARRLARWNGNLFSPLDGASGEVLTLTSFRIGSGQELAVGGGFDEVGGLDSRGFGRWRFDGWSALSPGGAAGIAGRIKPMLTWDDGSGSALYVGGEFQNADGQPAGNLARWDGRRWSVLAGPGGAGTDGQVVALAAGVDGAGPALYAAGEFRHAGGLESPFVARWNGSAWSALPAPGDVAYFVRALALYDDGSGPALYAGGAFQIDGRGTSVLRWDGADWTAVEEAGGNTVFGSAFALTTYDPGDGPVLVAAGRLWDHDGEVSRIATWDGTAWDPMAGPAGNGIDREVYALTVVDEPAGPALYVGGWFGAAGGIGSVNIARWDGQWSAMPILDTVFALVAGDDGRGPTLFAAGNFVVRWDGSGWEELVAPGSDSVDDYALGLASGRGGIFAGGRFQNAGGVPSSAVGRWRCPFFADGFESGDLTAWSAAAGGT